MTGIHLPNNHLKLNLKAVGKSSYLDILKLQAYFYMAEKNDDGYIHLKNFDNNLLQYLGLVLDGFVEFAYEKPNLFMYPIPIDTGYKLTIVDQNKNHYSIKCRKVFQAIRFIPQPPRRENAENSGVYPPMQIYNYNQIIGLLFNLGGLVK